MRKTVCQLIQYHMAMNFQIDLFIFLQQLWLPQWPYTRCDMLPSLSLTCFAIPASTEAQAKDKLLCRENKWQNPKSKNMDSNPKRKIFISLKFSLERKDVPAISIPFPWDGILKHRFQRQKRVPLPWTFASEVCLWVMKKWRWLDSWFFVPWNINNWRISAAWWANMVRKVWRFDDWFFSLASPDVTRVMPNGCQELLGVICFFWTSLRYQELIYILVNSISCEKKSGYVTISV